jgi:hypothetical protein
MDGRISHVIIGGKRMWRMSAFRERAAEDLPIRVRRLEESLGSARVAGVRSEDLGKRSESEEVVIGV